MGTGLLATQHAPPQLPQNARPQRGSAGRPSQRGTDVRLQLREALSDLEQPDLQQQAVFAIETLLRQAADGPVLDYFLRELFQRLVDCSGSARRLRYRLGALALRCHPSADWGSTLLYVRDRLVDRVGLEDHTQAAAELQGFAQQLAAAFIEAYCRGHYAALGHHTGKDELPRDWLSDLLITPLLRAACRGPARTRVANGCLLVHGVLLEFGRWSKSGGVLHAAVDCLKQMLKLTSTGALALSAGEALLPLQSCVELLGPRLKAAALEGILQLCKQAMIRSEWQVRKAAADTLAVLAETLLAVGPTQGAPAAGLSGGCQQQGKAALESIAPAIVAAVEQHLKYDRIPQVRQAGAALLQQLQQLPGLQQQEQRPPVQQLVKDGAPGGAAVGPSSGRPKPASAAVAPLAAVPASPKGLGRCRGNLQAVIAERRRQLKEAGWQPVAAHVEVFGSSKAADAAAGAAACHASSVGSAGGDSDGEGRIRAWGGSMAGPRLQAQQEQEQGAAGGTRQQQRPPSAEAFHSAAEALQWLEPPAQQQPPAAKRRVWGSQPASPAKQPPAAAAAAPAGGIQAHLHAPRMPTHAPGGAAGGAGGMPPAKPPPPLLQQQQQRHWRENPLAHASLEDGQTVAAAGVPAGVPPAGSAVPCVHHLQHPQFQLRLQTSPPEVELRLAGSSCGQALPPLCSVRFWGPGDGGADVGVEFGFAAKEPDSTAPAALHRYWVHQGQLHQQHVGNRGLQVGGVTGCRPPFAAAAAAPPAALSPRQQRTPTPTLPAVPAVPLQEQQLQEQQEQLERTDASSAQQVRPLSAAQTLLAESPLASLATAALPSFSPDKPSAAGGAAGVVSSAAVLGSTSTPPVTAAGWEVGGAAAAAPCGRVPLGQGAGHPPPAGVRSSSPVQQHHPATVRWAASLRPPVEQLLPGLPDWDRTSAGAGAGAGGDATGAGAGSRPGSPRPGVGGGSRPGSQPGSRPTSPSRLSQPHQLPPQHPQTQEAEQALSGAGGSRQVAGSNPSDKQRQQVQQRGAQPPSLHCTDTEQWGPPPHQPAGSPRSRQHAGVQQWAGGSQQHHHGPQLMEGTGMPGSDVAGPSPGPGPLTAMVTRAVSKLQTLHQLQEELQLPPHAMPAGPCTEHGGSGGCGLQAGSAAQDPLSLRRSLQPALSAILEMEGPLSQEEGCDGSGSSSSGAPHAGMQPAAVAAGSPPSEQQQQQERSQQPQPQPPQKQRAQGLAGGSGCGQEMGRLRQLQEQLQLNMVEIQRRIDAQEALPGAAAADSLALDSPAHMPAAWDAQEQLPAPGEHRRYAHQGASSSSPGSGSDDAADDNDGAGGGGQHPVGRSRLSSDWDAAPAAAAAAGEVGAQLDEHGAGGSGAGGGGMMAVDNPLFGSSRPGTARGMQRMHDMLPPKRSLVPRHSTSESEAEAGEPQWRRSPGERQHKQEQRQGQWDARASSASLQSAAEAGRQRRQQQAQQQALQQEPPPQEAQRQWKPSPRFSSGGAAMSLGSLGSGFGVLHAESEVEVLQLLRGSLAVSPQEQEGQLGGQQLQGQRQEGADAVATAAATTCAPAPAPSLAAALQASIQAARQLRHAGLPKPVPGSPGAAPAPPAAAQVASGSGGGADDACTPLASNPVSDGGSSGAAAADSPPAAGTHTGWQTARTTMQPCASQGSLAAAGSCTQTGWQTAVTSAEPSASPHGSPAAAAAAGRAAGGAPAQRRQWYGSLDLSAILGSQPVSPDRRFCGWDSSSSTGGGGGGGSSGEENESSADRQQAGRSGADGDEPPGQVQLRQASSPRRRPSSSGSSSSSGTAGSSEWPSRPLLEDARDDPRRRQVMAAVGEPAVVAQLQLLRVTSRPASPQHVPAAPHAQGAGLAGTSSAGGGGSARGTGGGSGSTRGSGGGGPTGNCGSARASSCSSGGSLSEVVRQTFPADAVQRLEQLKAQLSPGRRQEGAAGRRSAAGSPAQWRTAAQQEQQRQQQCGDHHRRQQQQQVTQQQQQQQHWICEGGSGAMLHGTAAQHQQAGSPCGAKGGVESRSGSPTPKRQRQLYHPAAGAAAGPTSLAAEAPPPPQASSSRGSSWQGSPEQQQQQQQQQCSHSGQCSPAALAQLLPRRAASPLLPGLRISRRQARLLQSAVGRMAGNPGESADVADIQAALMDVLEQHTAKVQDHYQRAAAERLALLRQQHGRNLHLLNQVLARETPLLEQAQEAAVRGELNGFVQQALPRLAEVLSSKELLLRCFEATAEGLDDNSDDDYDEDWEENNEE